MCYFKKAMAMLLAVVMVLSVAAVAFAAEEDSNKLVYSPTKGDTTTYTWDYQNGWNGSQDFGGTATETHKNGNTIVFRMRNQYGVDKTMVTDVAATKAGTVISLAGMVDGKTDWDEEKKKYTGVYRPETSEIEQIGTGNYGIAANEKGESVTGLNVKSKAPLVTVASRALQDSKIANVVLDCDNVLIEKNACKGTKAKTVAFAFPQATKANQITIKKGAFNGTKKVRIVVSAKMTSKELKKLKKKLKKQLGAAAYKKIKIVRG